MFVKTNTALILQHLKKQIKKITFLLIFKMNKTNMPKANACALSITIH